MARNDRWGRTYESFGELPELPSAMTTGGTDQCGTAATEAELRAVHLPPFRAAVQRGVGSVMVSYSSWNAVKMHGNRYLITDVLKGEHRRCGPVSSRWRAWTTRTAGS